MVRLFPDKKSKPGTDLEPDKYILERSVLLGEKC